MGCGSSIAKTDESLDHVRDAVWTGAGVAAYTVTGSGSRVDGVYVRDGKYDGAPLFKNGQNWLVRYGGYWYIGDKDKLDEDDGDYYRFDNPHDDALPSNVGWEVAESGREPVPNIQMVEEGPASYLVQGAGLLAANGTYRRDGVYDGAPRYVNGQLCIVRSRGNWYKWMIADASKIDENDGDLYQSQIASEYPPCSKSSWELSDDGKEPIPEFIALDMLGQPVLPGWVAQAVHPGYVAAADFVLQGAPVLAVPLSS
jgi:hypothetical protein